MRWRTETTVWCALLVALGAVGGPIPAGAATVAYWRFEEGPDGAVVPHAGGAGVFDGAVADVSGNGNRLSAWTAGSWAGFAYRADVPRAEVPGHGGANRFSVQNTGPYPAMFTSAAGSLPVGINAETMTPARFTVEASYKPEANGGFRTLVGRDATNLAAANGSLAAFYLQIRPDDSARVMFVDVSGFVHEASSPPGWIYGFNLGANPDGAGVPWYHFAGVSDGDTLDLYVDNVRVASTDLTASGSPNRALARGAGGGTDWRSGAWSVGRGLYAGGHTDRAYGFIDEVRISDVALPPAEFLFARRPVFQAFHPTAATHEFTLLETAAGATNVLLFTTDPTLPLDQWGQRRLRPTDIDGAYSFLNAAGAGAAHCFYALRTDIPPPGPGPMTYSLVGDWPADARARIVYAMDGAVALYNRYGTFNKHVWVNYNPGVPTAQASFSGWIDFGSNAAYQNLRTALHEIAHTLGVGTTWQWGANVSGGKWAGAHGVARIRALDGPDAAISSDGTHFWPYGLNYDSEGNTESYRRHVLMMAAFRTDMGVE